jgi:DNA-binding transcriptional MocR family regulator
MRCGYIAARTDWIEGLIDLQVATSFGGSSPIAAGLIAGVLAGGTYRKHMDDVRRRLANARTEAVDRLAALGIVPWIMPRGGFYLWCRLPDGHDSTVIARRCMERRVILAPGNAFSTSQSAAPFVRFNVAQMSDKHVFSTLEHVMKGRDGE